MKQSTGKRQGFRPWDKAIILDRERFLSYPNVRSVSLGLKERQRRVTRRMCVKVYVEKKTSTKSRHTIPKSARVLVPVGRGHYKTLRVPTDVVWFSEPAFCVAATDFFNPAVGGAQVVIPGIAEGTLSCMVRNAAGQTFAVTAAHVVMGGTVGGVPIGRVVMQPRILPRGLPVTTSIQLGRTRGGTFGNILDGFVDFCLIELRQGRTGLSVPFDSGPFSGQILSPNQVFGSTIPITKLGAVTGRTAGVFSRSVTEEIINGVPVRNVFEFKGLGPGIFCSIGDSGALVTTINGAVIGILFAVMAPTPDAPFGRGFVFPFSRMGFGIV